MIKHKTINVYKDAIRSNTGKNINLTLKRGRKYITINECTITEVYDSIFVVTINGESLINCKKLSVCYADLLTGNARVTVISDSKGA